MTVVSYVALGSNQDNPIRQITRAISALQILPVTEVTAYSRLYQSEPVGPGSQSDYINAVVSLNTALSALSLLKALQHIEREQGRVRSVRWGARTIDLDIILYGNERIHTPELIIPHKEMHWRSFVLLPLQDINPDIILPAGMVLSELVMQCDLSGIRCLGDAEKFFLQKEHLAMDD